MKRFTALCRRLDATTRTNEKVAAVRDYFREAPADDAAVALAMLSGDRQRRVVTTTELREWAAEAAGIPLWLLEECYATVGDLAETLALVLPDPASRAEDADGQPHAVATADDADGLASIVRDTLHAMKGLDAAERKRIVVETWRKLGREERFLWHKMLTGGFRMGVARTLVARALSELASVDPATMAHRLMGLSSPSAEDFASLMAAEGAATDRLRPYPFFLASPLEGGPEPLGDVDAWQAEWKWDGMRAQLIAREESVAIWTRGEELATDAFPEIVEAASALRRRIGIDCVLDGELLVVGERGLLDFQALSKRIGRKRLTKKLLADLPVVFVAYDLLELGGEDLRRLPLAERRRRLEEIVSVPFEPRQQAACDDRLFLSPVVEAGSWQSLATLRDESRSRGVEGLMLKRCESGYGVGRTRGDWWKWKVEPLEIDAVLLYAQAGHGRRATLHTDYTLGVWSEGRLVPVAKAYSGLSDAELVEVDRIIRRTTLEKHGPVRVVEPSLVFEIAFESVARSTRHKAGLAVRFPRIKRWRRDKLPADAGSLADLAGLLRRHEDASEVSCTAHERGQT
jgi:DNA ligase-1